MPNKILYRNNLSSKSVRQIEHHMLRNINHMLKYDHYGLFHTCFQNDNWIKLTASISITGCLLTIFCSIGFHTYSCSSTRSTWQRTSRPFFPISPSLLTSFRNYKIIDFKPAVVVSTGEGVVSTAVGAHDVPAHKGSAEGSTVVCEATKLINAKWQKVFIFGFVFLFQACTYKLISLLGIGQRVRAP